MLSKLLARLPKQILGPGLIALAIKMAGAVLAYGMIVALARMMTVEEYGRFAFGLNLSIIAATVGGLGFPVGVLRYWPKALVAKDDAGARGIVSMGYRYSAITGLAIIALAAAGSLIAGLITGKFELLQFLAIGTWASSSASLIFRPISCARKAARLSQCCRVMCCGASSPCWVQVLSLPLAMPFQALSRLPSACWFLLPSPIGNSPTSERT